MPKLKITNKNGYFTYFELDGVVGKFRMMKQIWNADGISIMVQGPSWDNAGINGFGKRHLLSTVGGDNAGNPLTKAASILNKRQGGVGGGGRANKQNEMVNKWAPKPANMRDSEARKEYTAKWNGAKKEFEKGYSVAAYGPETTICTFVLLDDMTPEEVASCFAKPIKEAKMADGNDMHVKVTFASDIVINVANDSDVKRFYSINVSVKRVGGIY